MPIFGIDYAWSKPSVKAMTDAGVKFIARYLSNDSSKDLSRSEATAANNAGIWCVVVWETTADRALSGRAGGEADARKARDKADALGMPDDRPIYFAVDWDASEGQQATINAYFDGAASVLGRDRVGMYGGYWPIKRAFDAKKIVWGWQTYAWSGGRWDSRAHIQQYRNGVNLGGADVDYDRAMYDDYGQWMVGKSPNGDSMPSVEEIWQWDHIPSPRNATTHADNPTWMPQSFLTDIAERVRDVQSTVNAMAGKPTDDMDEQAIIAGVLAGLNPETIAETIATRLGPDMASRILDEMKNRLES